MKKINLFLLRFYGYSSFILGIGGFIVGIFAGILFVIATLLNHFREFKLVRFNDIIYCIFFGAVFTLLGIGILGRKKWGRLFSIIFLIYSTLNTTFVTINLYKLNAILVTKITNIALIIFSLLFLYVFLLPSTKDYFIKQK